MGFVRQYSLCLICAALICGILQGMVKGKSFEKQVRFLCGLFFTLTVVQPLVNLELAALPEVKLPVFQQAQAACDAANQITAEQLAEVIRQETAAYIWNKAEAMHTRLQVTVELNSETPPVPWSVTIVGQVGAPERRQLEQMIASELNIPKERQRWIGED